MSIEDRQLLDIGKMVGLTIKGVSKEYANGQMAISFSSGQFIILEAEHDGYGDARILVDEYPPYPSNIMVEAKVFTEKEHDAWEEKEFVDAIKATGRKKLIMGGLWTDVCLAYPAIDAVKAGYDVHVPEDVVGSITRLSHENGMRRMEQAGVKRLTWNVVLAELQRDHARSATEKEVSRIFLEHLFKMDPDKGWN